MLQNKIIMKDSLQYLYCLTRNWDDKVKTFWHICSKWNFGTVDLKLAVHSIYFDLKRNISEFQAIVFNLLFIMVKSSICTNHPTFSCITWKTIIFDIFWSYSKPSIGRNLDFESFWLRRYKIFDFNDWK